MLVYLASLALKKIAVAARDLASYSVKGEIPARAAEAVERHLGYFKLKGKRIKLFFSTLIVLGAAVSAVNFLQTSDPVKAFGNYTFDSIKYFWGFLFTRISNTLLYTLVFPILIFEILLITLMLVRLLRAMVDEGALYIDFFNDDDCGGMSAFGFINVLIMLFWVVVFCIILCDFLVQKEVATTLVISAVFCSTLFIVQSVWGVYSIHTCVQSKKTETLAEIEKVLKTITAGELQVNTVLKYIMAGEVPLERIPPVMQLREVVRSTRTVPYTRNAAIAVNTMRIAPPVMAVIRLFA
ncbi:MAG TPA: hypothetical protein VN493_22780 [Thermoanaerobaculia bacterium]|nr:hypothetical protein [Thermoanaerobaculia bacterium]